MLCQRLEPELLGDGSQQVGEGGTHPGQNHEELQVREEEGPLRGVQGGGCVHHEEHSHWPGLDLENKLIIVFSILSGQAQYIYQQQYKAEHRVGGPDQTFRNPVGLRFSFCLVGDLCQVRLFFRLKQQYYRSLSFLTTGSTIAWRSGRPLQRRNYVKRRGGFPWWQKTKNL